MVRSKVISLLKPVYNYQRKVAKARIKATSSTYRKLHLGCGSVHIDGYCNVDITDSPVVDIIDDVAKLNKFGNNFAEQIYACHVLEHFSHAEVQQVLQRWFDVLQPGGEVRISVPDLDKIVKIYLDNWEHFQTPGNTPWIGLIYGGQIDRYDFHKTGFNLCWMSNLLNSVGFVDVEEYEHMPHFIPGLRDASLVKEPFGEFISLNVKATKPL